MGDILNEIRNQFGCNDNSELFEKFIEAYTKNDSEFYKKLQGVIYGNEKDCLRMIYQYYCADREDYKQDFTPETLSQLVAKLAVRDEFCTILDCCAGVGSLTLQAAKLFKNKKFTLLEKNENTLPFTKANVEANKISANILHYDVIEDLNLEGDAEDSSFTCDCCISNPPFNLKWQHPLFALQLPRFQTALPPEQIQQSAEATKKINEAMQGLGVKTKIWTPNPIIISKDKNVIRLEQNSDVDGISSILTTMINCWTQHMFYLNEKENVLLAELRDALLPKLMNGECS